VAAERGHQVTLYERSRYLGGALVMASTVHRENQPFLDYLLRELERLPVELRLGESVTPDHIAALSPDAVVVATGGRVVAPKLSGDDLRHVLTGSQLRELLAGVLSSELRTRLPGWQRAGVALLGGALQRFVSPAMLRNATRIWMPLGRQVVIIGADLAAVELAEFLAERGRQVSVLEMGEQIAPEVGMKRRSEHMERLDRARVPLNTGVTVDRITERGVVVRRRHGSELLIPADSVILAGEVEPSTEFHDALQGRVPELYAVGDCTGLGLIQKAVLEGARAGSAI
jgi:2,4-dienoyl-CoA reductase (NADPH2)